MILFLKVIFWLSFFGILYTYIGYPILISLAARLKGKPPLAMPSMYPSVSVIISVFNEEKFIGKKIENCLSLDYPKDRLEILVGSDGSTDNTGDIIKSYSGSGVIGHDFKPRQGKPAVINALVKAANGEVLFFTDARQPLEANALKELVKNFSDEKIGCVSGELLYYKDDSITGRGIGLYWEYEKYLREKESAVYSMLGATGAIYACRKALFEPIPEDIILDDVYLPFVIVSKGYMSVFDRFAKAYDVTAETPHDEYRRKVRTLSGNFQIFFRMPHMLNPFRSKLALQIISHKLFRAIAPFFMVAMFLSNFFLVGAPFYKYMFIGQAAFYIVTALEALFRRRIRGILGLPYLFCLLNFSALVGFYRFLFGKQNIAWEK